MRTLFLACIAHRVDTETPPRGYKLLLQNNFYSTGGE